MKSTIKTIVLYALIIGVVIMLSVYLLDEMNKADRLSYSQMVDMIYTDQVKTFSINEKNVLTLETVDGKTYARQIRSVDRFLYDIEDYLEKRLQTPEDQRILTNYDVSEPQQTSWFLSFLPTIIIAVVLFALWFFLMNKASGEGKMGSFGKARVKTLQSDKTAVHFNDVAGADEEKEELKEIVEYLKNPQKFAKLGARIPRGVLLMGPPGTGKTLLAKAVAGEANVPFLSISGSDFMEMYVGVGAARVRDLFETAKKAPASIIFIDEIDAVGRHRGAGLGGGHDEREQTLNQLLVEMDGFSTHDGVIVIAATNRPDILDPALLRPGRFDRQITVSYPDIKGREEILMVHAKGKPFENTVDMKKIAKMTAGYTGADLANLLNEAALLAARNGKTLIGTNDIEDAWIKISVGVQKKKNSIKEEDKRKTAYHEAGHALLAHLLPTQDPVHQITIIPTGRALGYTFNPPVDDRYSVYKNQLKEEITMLLGGRAAEEIIYKDVSGGASNDIQRATDIARQMVTKLGMSEVIGTIHLGGSHSSDEVFLGRDFSATQNYSDKTAAIIDEEIKKIVDEAYKKAIDMLNENREKLDYIVEYLMRNETMSGEEFEMAMNGATIEEIEASTESKRQKSKEENENRQKALDAEKAREEERLKKEAEENERLKANSDHQRFPWEQ